MSPKLKGDIGGVNYLACFFSVPHINDNDE